MDKTGREHALLKTVLMSFMNPMKYEGEDLPSAQYHHNGCDAS